MTADLRKASISDLRAAIKAHNRKAREKWGPWGSLRRIVMCPHCKDKMGVRQLRKHKGICSKNPNQKKNIERRKERNSTDRRAA